MPVPGSGRDRNNAVVIAIPAGSFPWMQPTTSSVRAPCPSTTGRIARPWTLWPTGSAASRAARKRTVGILHHMKRFSVIALAAALLAGCGGSSKSSNSSSTNATTTAGKKAYVVLVTDIGQLNDHGFNQLAYNGLKRAERNLGVRGDVFQSPSSADYVPNLATAARKGADLVISVGFDQASSIAKVAKQFPNTHFAIIDVDWHDLPGRPPNVEGLVFREQQVGYLAGYLAGLVEKSQGGSNTIGSVGGQKQPPVDRYIAGYQAGAKAADPGVKLLNGYSQEWVDQAKCKTIAQNQIDAGANVVFQVAGGCGLGVLDAAKQDHVWGIGVDADQSYIGPQVLTSAEKGVDTSVYSTVQQVLDNNFKGGTNAVFDLSNDGVRLGKISAKVPSTDKQKVEAVAKQIASGKITNIPTEVK
jgi:basic membrane protein A and related proteins